MAACPAGAVTKSLPLLVVDAADDDVCGCGSACGDIVDNDAAAELLPPPGCCGCDWEEAEEWVLMLMSMATASDFMVPLPRYLAFIERSKIEINPSIWREEIQNRNQLLNVAGRNSK